MGGIVISQAPKEYQKYLNIGDKAPNIGNGDGRLNLPGEARKSAESYCEENLAGDYQRFLEYLEKSGYPPSQTEIKCEPNEPSKIAERTGYKDEALALIEIFRKEGLIKRFGIDKLKELMFVVSKSSGPDTCWAYVTLGRLVKKGYIDKFGIPNLIEIAKAAGSDTRWAYVTIEKLFDKGLIDEIGTSNLVEIAKAAKKITSYAYDALEKLAEKGLIKKIGIERVKAFLIEIPKVAGIGTGKAYSVLDELAVKGLINESNFSQVKSLLIDIGKALYWDDWKLSVYSTLEKLAIKGLIGKFGISQIRTLFIDIIDNVIGSDIKYACSVLEKLSEKGIIEKYGVNNVKSLIIEIAKAPCTFCSGKFSEFLSLEGLIGKGVVEKIGIPSLIEITKAAGSKTGRLGPPNIVLAYDAIIKLNEKGLIEKIGVPRLIEIARKAGPDTYKRYEELLKRYSE